MRNVTLRAGLVGAVAVLTFAGSAPARCAAETPATPVRTVEEIGDIDLRIVPGPNRLGQTVATADQRRAVPRRPRSRPVPRVVQPPSRPTVVVRTWYPWYSYYHPYYGYWYGSWWPRYWVPIPGEYDDTGSVRLKVEPRHAEVFADGYYVGRVDDFDGTFQALRLEPGPVHLDIRAEGFENVSVDVMILPGRKLTYEALMRPGVPEPVGPLASDPATSAELDRARPPSSGDEVPPPAIGSVRLDIEPSDARVFVEGYYVGVVEDFSGGNGLPLESGPQTLEVRADGYVPLELKVRILPGETITYRGVLRPLSSETN